MLIKRNPPLVHHAKTGKFVHRQRLPAAWTGWTSGSRNQKKIGKRFRGCAIRPICARAPSRRTRRARFPTHTTRSANVFLFGLYIDGELASSVRIHVGSKEHPDFPSLHVFPEALQPHIDDGKVIIDTTRFVADEAMSRLYRGLPYATLRASWLAGSYFAADYSLAAVRAEHQAFYRRMFHHQLICEPRPYPHLAKPICLMWIHYPIVAEDVQRRYPFFRSTLFERRMLFEGHARGAWQQAPSPISPRMSDARAGAG